MNMTNRRATMGLALMAAIAVPAVAEARVMDLRLSGNAGGMFGWGTTSGTQDMFREASGAGFGFEAGFKLVIFDFAVSMMQMLRSDGVGATLLQGTFGTEVDFPAGRMKLPNGQSAQIIHAGFAGGVVLGTNDPAVYPVTNDQLADKGVIGRFRVGYEFFLNEFMGIGAQGDFGYHYLLGGQAINNTQDHSTGYHLVGLAHFTFHLGF
jgi:hypothetical protein